MDIHPKIGSQTRAEVVIGDFGDEMALGFRARRVRSWVGVVTTALIDDFFHGGNKDYPNRLYPKTVEISNAHLGKYLGKLVYAQVRPDPHYVTHSGYDIGARTDELKASIVGYFTNLDSQIPKSSPSDLGEDPYSSILGGYGWHENPPQDTI